MEMRLTSILLFSCLAALSVGPPIAAQEINFEEALPAPQNVRLQYCADTALNRGVEFLSAVEVVEPVDGLGDPLTTASPTHAAIRLPGDDVGGQPPVVVSFTTGQSRVAVRAGNTSTESSAVTVTLRAFDEAGAGEGVELTADPPPTLNLGAGPNPITGLLEFETADASQTIRRVQITATNTDGFALLAAIDDLEFSHVGPPCIDDNEPPQVTLLLPEQGQTLSSPELLLSYEATDDVEIATVQVIMLENISTTIGSFVGSRSAGPSSFFTQVLDGTSRVRVTATDFSGKTGSDEAAINLQLPGADLNLWVLGMEITQIIQGAVPVAEDSRAHFASRATLQSVVPLVAGKRTVVRVFPGVEGTTVPVVGARASLHCLTSLGLNLGAGVRCPGPLGADAIRSGITVDPANGNDLETLRSDGTASWNFVLPTEWTESGGPRFLVAVVNSPPGVPECGRGTADDCDDGANFFVLELGPSAFWEVPPLQVQPIFACVRRDPDVPETDCTTLATNSIVASALVQSILWANNWDLNGGVDPFQSLVYPVAQLGRGTQIGFPRLNEFIDGDFDAEDGMGNPARPAPMNYDRMSALLAQICQGSDLDRLGDLFAGAGSPVYLALVDPPTGPSGIAYSPSSCAVAKFDLDPGRVDDNDYCDNCVGDPNLNIHFDEPSVSHEIGHTFGLKHASCDHPADEGLDGDDCDPAPGVFPCPHGGICLSAAQQDEPWIFDTFRMRPLPPRSGSTHAHDFMSYGSKPTWVSAHTYRRLFSGLREALNSATSGDGPAVPFDANGLFVAGSLQQPGDELSLGPVYGLALKPAALPTEEGSGAMSLELQDELGTVLARHRFDPAASLSDAPDSSAYFSAVLPDLADARRLVVKKDDVTLVERARSAAAPAVVLQTPGAAEVWDSGPQIIDWTATDADADLMMSTVQYSNNAGESWRTLATNRTQTTLEVESSLLAGSAIGGARIRVITSDGFNSSRVDSEPFTVERKMPSARILSPEDGQVFDQGDLVILLGGALDVDDGGTLPDESLTWSSSLDGALGDGGELPTAGLSAGAHTITLTALDSDGEAASAAIVVTIDPRPNSQPRADAGEDRLVMIGSHVELDGSASLDADGDPLSFSWRIVSSPATLVLDTTQPTFGFLASEPGLYEIELVVSDGQVESFPAAVVVTAEEVVEPPLEPHRDSFELGLGFALPIGSANDAFDPGPAASIGYRRSLVGRWSLVGNVGYSAFDGGRSARDMDLGLWDIGVSARHDTRQPSIADLFLKAGLGYYAPETDFGAGDVGLRLGLGLSVPLASAGVELEVGLEGHKVFAGSGRDLDFVRALIGLAVRR